MATRRDPADDLLRAVGRRMAEIRRAAGLTQEQVAELLGVSPRAYAYLEGGRENLKLRTMASVAKVLGCGVADLFVPPASQEVRRGRPRRHPVPALKEPPNTSATLLTPAEVEAMLATEEGLESIIRLAASSATAQANRGVEWIADASRVLDAIQRAAHTLRLARAHTPSGSGSDPELPGRFISKLRDLSLEFLATADAEEKPARPRKKTGTSRTR